MDTTTINSASPQFPLPPGTTVEHFTQEPNLAIFGWLQAVIPSPRGHSGPLPGTQKLIFIAFFPINFNSTALFKNAFLGLDLAGRPFGGDCQQLCPWKMKKS